MVENYLCLKDANLFDLIKREMLSEAEKLFFETMYYKQTQELALCDELLVSEIEGYVPVQLSRWGYQDYYLSVAERRNEHYRCLADVLEAVVKIEGCTTLYEWLSRVDFSVVTYGRYAPPIYQCELCKKDAKLFSTMAMTYQSERERVFFERMRQKQLIDFSNSYDPIMQHTSNEDKIAIVRAYSDEYFVGKDGRWNDAHFVCLADALQMKLGLLAICDGDLTLLEWLRARDYRGVHYDANIDNH